MKKVLFWLLVISGTMTAVQAQTNLGTKQKQTLSLSLEQAQQYAVENNRTIKEAGIAAKQAEQTKWVAISNYLPQANASYSQTGYFVDSIFIPLFGGNIPMKSSSSVNIQVSQAILNLNILVGIQLSKLGLQMSENMIEQTALTVKQNVNTSYYSILLLENNKQILEKNLANVRILAKATRDKVKVGIGEPLEADQVDVTVANLENTLQSTERNIEVAYNSMRLLLGLGAADELKLTSDLSSLMDKTNTFELLVQSFQIDQNIDKKNSDLSLEIYKKQYQSAVASIMPTLSLGYVHTEKIMKSTFDMQPKDTYSFSASMPLFAGGKNYANIRKAKLACLSSQLENDQLKDQLLLQEKQLRYNLKSAQASYEIQKKNIEVSQRVFDNITRKYQQGLTSSLELTMANNNLLTAQGNYINAIMTLLSAQDALQKLLGTL
ncbi:MAG: TolC family protein [Bacteroidales bacterium]|nr:TolC family protein [Bacteroidales bacterium]